MIHIVDYGMGNLGSIINMFKRIGVKASIADTAEKIEAAEKLLLPGVGAFDSAINRIHDLGLYDALEKKVMQNKVPILGICLGMQLFTRGSDEGNLPGFGWIPAQVKRFPVRSDLKVPHMGWNRVVVNQASRLISDLPAECRFYFVHSYYVSVDDPGHSILRTNYGLEFDSGIQCNNIFGVQFHPEKSHKFGMQLMKNFSDL